MNKSVNKSNDTFLYWAAMLMICLGASMAGLNPASIIAVTIMPLMCFNAITLCASSLHDKAQKLTADVMNYFHKDTYISKPTLNKTFYSAVCAVNVLCPSITLPALTALAFSDEARHVRAPGEAILALLNSSAQK